MRLQRGARVDRYTLLEPIGEGGQARVWRVVDRLEPEKPRAAKLMDLSFAPMAAAERVRREARQLVQLDHPSLVVCHALFEDVHEQLLGVVMDYVEGCNVREALDDPRFTERHRLALLHRVADVLAYLHERGIVHRDLKPDNVLLTNEFRDDPSSPSNVKLVDFGIASPAGNPAPLTQIGNIVGTPAFMAPEALDPLTWPGGTATAAVDVYAFGVLAWTVLLGGHPTGLRDDSEPVAYAGTYRALAQTGTPWPPPHGTTPWRPILERCLSLRTTDRPRDGAELASFITATESGESAAPPRMLPQASRETPAPFEVGTTLDTQLSGSSAPPQRTEPGFPPVLQSAAPPPVSARRSNGAWLGTIAAAVGGALVLLLAIGAFVLSDHLDAALSADDDADPPAPRPTRAPQPAAPPAAQLTEADLERARREVAEEKERAKEAEKRAAEAERQRVNSEAPGKVLVSSTNCRCASSRRIIVDCTVTNPSPVAMSVDLKANAETRTWGANSRGERTASIPANTTRSVPVETSFDGLMNCNSAKNCKCTKVSARVVATKPP